MYGWIDDPEPPHWPADVKFRFGAVVRVNNIEALAGRTGVVTGYERLNEPGGYRYNVLFADESISWTLKESLIEGTGEVSLENLPPRQRAVLGNGTVVRMSNVQSTQELGIDGRVALTEGLWWIDSEGPAGYIVRLPGDREVHLVPFGAFEIEQGFHPPYPDAPCTRP